MGARSLDELEVLNLVLAFVPFVLAVRLTPMLPAPAPVAKLPLVPKDDTRLPPTALETPVLLPIEVTELLLVPNRELSPTLPVPLGPKRELRTRSPTEELPVLELVLAPDGPNKGIGERVRAAAATVSMLPLRLEVDPPDGIRLVEGTVLVIVDRRVDIGPALEVGFDAGIPDPFVAVAPPLFHTL